MSKGYLCEKLGIGGVTCLSFQQSDSRGRQEGIRGEWKEEREGG